MSFFNFSTHQNGLKHFSLDKCYLSSATHKAQCVLVCDNICIMEQRRRNTHLLASPVSTSSNLVKSWWRTLGQILSDPVNEKLFGRLSCPAASCVVKIANVLWLVLFHNCIGKCNNMVSNIVCIRERSPIINYCIENMVRIVCTHIDDDSLNTLFICG